MPTISDISFRRRRPERFIVQFDEGEAILFSPEIALKFQFAPGKSYSPREFDRCLRENAVRCAKDQMLTYLERRAHSRTELIRKTGRKGYRHEEIHAALEQLARVGLVDDRVFARQFIQNEIRLRPAGRRLIERKLRERGVDPEVFAPIVTELCGETQETRAIDLVAEKFLRTHPRLGSDRLRQQLVSHLRGKGFSWDSIHQVMGGIGEEMD